MDRKRTTTKRCPATSADFAVRALVNAGMGPLGVPEHVALRPGDKPFWDGVVRARARDEWTECDLVIAAQLARCQADIESESRLLEAEGSVLINARGRQVVNRRVAVLELLTRRALALMRSLRMTGRVAGDMRDEAGRRIAERQAAEVRAGMDDEDYLAQ